MYSPTQARREAILRAKNELALKPVYLDTETTGLDPTDQIVEICIVDHDGAILLDSLVKPTGRIPASATRIHGITDSMVRKSPSWPDLWPQVEAALAGRRIAIYNADFDVRLLQQSHLCHRMSWPVDPLSAFCVMRLYAQFRGEWNSRYGSYRWQTLETAVTQCRINGLIAPAHRAQADTLAARAVLHHMAGFAS